MCDWVLNTPLKFSKIQRKSKSFRSKAMRASCNILEFYRLVLMLFVPNHTCFLCFSYQIILVSAFRTKSYLFLMLFVPNHTCFLCFSYQIILVSAFRTKSYLFLMLFVPNHTCFLCFSYQIILVSAQKS